MDDVKRDFNKVAATWDENPGRLKLANDVADAIIAGIPLTREMDVLDFGCGTGLLTLRLQPLVRSVTGVDSSRGMLDMLDAKVRTLGVANVSTKLRDLDQGDRLNGSYDLVTTSMTFHHVKDVAKLLQTFHGVTRPGGWVAVADLDLEEGRFHDDHTGVFHHGFDRSVLQQALSGAGYGEVQATTAARIVKESAAGGSREFTVFLITGRRMPG